MISGVVSLVRPRQWLKNVLVAAAPLAAGTLLQPRVAAETLLAFAAFCLASSATYCLNDVLDADADAAHPTKRARPVPSGQVPRGVALGVGAVLAVAAVALAQPGWLRGVVLAYLAVTVAYSALLKHQPVIELGLIAAGFVLRAVGGGAASDTPLSQWFLIVTGFGSLFMVTGKRLSELQWAERQGDAARGTAVRRSLAHYPVSYLRMVLGASAAVTITGYCLWVAQVGSENPHGAWTWVSTWPFVLAILRYALDTDHGRVEEPEEVVLGDRVLQLLGLLWLVTYAVGVFL